MRGEEYTDVRQLAYQGKEGCRDVRCTRRGGKCVGYHCPRCHEPVSMMGHDCLAPVIPIRGEHGG